MGIDMKRFGEEVKRRRMKLTLTQDMLAAKVGVRLATIGRLEIGKIRPSLTMLEKLASALNCNVRDLLIEEEAKVATATEGEPSLKGAPSYFRYGIADAASRKIVGTDMNTGKPIRTSYAQPGWHLAVHLKEYLTREAWEELEALFEERGSPLQFERDLIQFLKRELPGCMRLVPPKRHGKFLQGMYRAIEDDRTCLNYGVTDLIDEEDE